jgi:hypothetical protein
MVSNLALFCLATYLATFQEIGRFFPNHLVTLSGTFFDKAGFKNVLFQCKGCTIVTMIVSSTLLLKVCLE